MSTEPVAPSALVSQRSKTVLLLVREIEDFAPIAALCALMGDLYRHRTFFAKDPIVVLRVLVPRSLRHYFVKDGKIVTWRAHESCSRSARWVTHVGAPDSIWTWEGENDDGASDIDCSVGLLEAYRGLPKSTLQLCHDDGGMADMILVGSSSSLSLSLWRQLAALTDSLRSNTSCQAHAPPLIIATLGSLRGQDWLSRRAFADLTKLQRQSAATRKWRRNLALLGFPSNL